MPVIHRYRLRRDTAASWSAVNPVLGPGEPGYESDSGGFKIGDGVTAWNALPLLLTDAASAALAQQAADDAVGSATSASASAIEAGSHAGDAQTYAATAQSSGVAAMDAATSASADATAAQSWRNAAASSASEAATSAGQAAAGAADVAQRAAQAQMDIASAVIVSATVSGDVLTLHRQNGTSFAVSGSVTGPTGPVGYLDPVVDVTTGAPGTSASASIDGEPGSQTLTLTVPRGDTGATGLVVVTHGTDGNVARPASPMVAWFGSARPVNALPTDLWMNS